MRHFGRQPAVDWAQTQIILPLCVRTSQLLEPTCFSIDRRNSAKVNNEDMPQQISELGPHLNVIHRRTVTFKPEPTLTSQV